MGVFRDLDRLVPGDAIELYWQGKRYDYSVVSNCRYPVDTAPWALIYAKTETERITLVQSGEHSQRQIVVAQRDRAEPQILDCLAEEASPQE